MLNWMKTNEVVITITLAFIGYFVTYINNIRIEKRKARIKFVSDQLQYLYGPLYSLSQASTQAWASFRSRCRPNGPFFGRSPSPTEQELEQWRLWMSWVFMPLNLDMEKAIVGNAHLIDGENMPDSFKALLAHIEVYKIVLKKWESGDFSEHTSYLNYPDGFINDISEKFAALKRRQVVLIGKQARLSY